MSHTPNCSPTCHLRFGTRQNKRWPLPNLFSVHADVFACLFASPESIDFLNSRDLYHYSTLLTYPLLTPGKIAGVVPNPRKPDDAQAYGSDIKLLLTHPLVGHDHIAGHVGIEPKQLFSLRTSPPLTTLRGATNTTVYS